YLKRNDLGQVNPEDLLSTGTQDNPAIAGAKGEKRRIPAAERHITASVRKAPVESGVSSPDPNLERAAQARIKGYEGDPCPACGSFTLVRNGTCMKCDTCGGTTGCS
ncbi:MAG: hypothetical protein LBP29_00125, partial [Treponema sp.]|nr:hypothetical protein [Treponema sp.]